MKKELYPLGALCKTPEEADPRDYQSEYVLGLPTEEELNNLPRKIDLIGIMEETWNQGSVGSCFDGNTKVLMGDFGYKQIKNIRKNDFVMTDNGPKRVLNTFTKRTEELNEIHINKIKGNQSKILCTPDHKFFVYENGNIIEKEAELLEKKDKILVPIQDIKEEDVDILDITNYISNNNIVLSIEGDYLYSLSGKLPKKIKLTNKLLSLMGYYCAEGCIDYMRGNESSIALTFHEDESDYIKECIDAVKEIDDSINIYEHKKKNSKAKTIKINNSILSMLFKSIFGHMCYNKDIPDFIYNLPFDRFNVFLKSFIKGDGYFTKTKDGKKVREIGITVTADRLINRIYNKLLYNKIPCSYEFRNNSTEIQKRRDVYGLYLYGKGCDILMPELFTGETYIKKYWDIEFIENNNNKYAILTIKKNNKIYQTKDVYDLEVEGEHTYITHGIKVHNCTAMGICHTLLSMNILDHKRKDMFIDYKYQRTHNQGKQWITNSGGDYLENAARTLKNNGVKGTIGGKDFVFEIDGYAVEERGSDFEKMLKIAMWHMSNGRPIYWAMYGNSKTRQECYAGEIKTIWRLKDGGTGGHAIEWGGIDFDRRKVKFANSWSWNSKNNDNRLSISSFEIDFDVFEQLLKNHDFNRRRWILFDKKDIPMEKLFEDFVGYDETSEAYKAVKRAKDNGVIKGVPTEDGFRLEPNRPMTRLEMLLVLYRLYGLK